MKSFSVQKFQSHYQLQYENSPVSLFLSNCESNPVATDGNKFNMKTFKIKVKLFFGNSTSANKCFHLKEYLLRTVI